jgi:O-antigen/teichoic acid export membrane protein
MGTRWQMNKTLKNIFYFLTAIFIAKFIGAFTSFFTAKILQPADFGIWITILLIASYAPILSFGTVETLLKQYPYHIGRGEVGKAKEIEKSVMGSIILSSALLFLIGTISYCVLRIKSTELMALMILVMFVTSSISFFSAFFYHRFAAHQNFKMVSLLETLRAFLSSVLVVVCAWFYGLKGAVIGFLFNEIIISSSSAVLSNKICGKISWNFNLRLIGQLIRIGLPITIIWWIFMIQSSADRLISISLLGKTATGFYGLGVTIVSIITLLPSAVSRVLYPKVSEGVGRQMAGKDMALLVVDPAFVLSLATPFLLGVILILLPSIYHYIFPQYLPGFASAQILLLGSFFLCLIRTGINYLISIDKQFLLIRYVLISLIFNILGNITLVKLGFNIEGIALSTGIAGAILATLVWKSVFQEMGYSKAEQLKKILNLYLPFILLLALLLLLYILFPAYHEELNFLNAHYILLFVFLFTTILYCIPPFRWSTKELCTLLKENIKKSKQTRHVHDH